MDINLELTSLDSRTCLIITRTVSVGEADGVLIMRLYNVLSVTPNIN